MKFKFKKRKSTILFFMLTTILFGVQVCAATYTGIASLKNNTYPSTEGLAICEGKPYVLKAKSGSSTETQLGTVSSGKVTWFKKNKTKLGHGNDMTYNTKDGYLYVAPASVTNSDNGHYVRKMAKDGTVYSKKIATNFTVGGIAYSINKNKFVLKQNGGKSYRVGTFSNDKFIEEFTFYISTPKKANQGICMRDGYIYIACSSGNNSYIYKTTTKFKNIKAGNTIGTTLYATITPDNLKKACTAIGMPSSGTITNVEIESLAFKGNTLYFSANVNYKKDGVEKAQDGLFSIN